MTSPLLSTTSRLPLSLEFSEESSSTTRSGTAPVTRITSRWRRPATWDKEPEGAGVKARPSDNGDLREKVLYSILSGPVPCEQLHGGCSALSVEEKPDTSRAGPLHHLPLYSSCLTLTQIHLLVTCLLESSSFLSFFYRMAQEQLRATIIFYLESPTCFPCMYIFTHLLI